MDPTSNGSLRIGPRSLAIGSAHKTDPFFITTPHSGHHLSKTWILGYAPKSGRWGYTAANKLG
jgi:hypothetical protein